MSTLDTIPVEISKLIELHLSNKQIKQLRLVSKELKSRVKLSIRRVFISLHEVLLRAASDTIRHEQFREDIEEIVWDSTQYQYPGEHESAFFEQRPTQSRMDQIIVARRLFLAQKELKRTAIDLQILRQALKLPNLKRITVTSHIWVSTDAGAPVYHLPLFRQVLKEMDLLPVPCKDFKPLLYETSRSGANLKEFAVDVTRRREYIGGHLFWNIQDEPTLNIQTICKNSHNLTRLDLSLNASLNWDQVVPCFANGLLKDLLSNLPRLEHLSLHANMDTDLGSPDTNPVFRPLWNTIEDIFPPHTAACLSKLKHLKLANLFMKTTSLITLLTNLPSLQYADLDRPELCTATGTFSVLFHQLKARLVDEKDGVWKERKTRLTIHSDRRGSRHKVVEDDITAFFYDGGICPYDVNAYKPTLYWWQTKEYSPSDRIRCVDD